MSTRTIKDLRAVHADLLAAEGMIAFLTDNTDYQSNSELVRDSLMILAEFLGTRTDRLDKLLSEVEN